MNATSKRYQTLSKPAAFPTPGMTLLDLEGDEDCPNVTWGGTGKIWVDRDGVDISKSLVHFCWAV